MAPLLRVQDLRVTFNVDGRKPLHALNGVSFEMRRGEIVGLVGESGSGKSTLAKTLLRVLPRSAEISSGAIEFETRRLLELDEAEMAKIRGAKIAVIPQEPSLSLNPLMKAGNQVAEVLHAHRDWSWSRCRQVAATLLDRVGLYRERPDIYSAYPHQLSGGQQRRVSIAQAVSCDPLLIIADEPTASLDPEAGQQVLRLLRQLTADMNSALLLITHDLRVLPEIADRMAVMYAGRIVEQGLAEQVLSEPQHPYTRALISCLPESKARRESVRPSRLPTIEGSAPDPENVASGCSFAPRCAKRLDFCDSHFPVPIETGRARLVECFLYGE